MQYRGVSLFLEVFIGILCCTPLLFLDGTNKTEKLLEASDSDYPEDLRIKYQKEYRRNKLDISSGFTNLKTQASDSHVRDFIEKLKETAFMTIIW